MNKVYITLDSYGNVRRVGKTKPSEKFIKDLKYSLGCAGKSDHVYTEKHELKN